MSGEVLCLIPGPTKMLASERGPERWCFKCRKRLPGAFVCFADEEPGYYEPVWAYRCGGCSGDSRFFPGTKWSW